MSTSARHFFMSYSREDGSLQRRVLGELRGRGINVWVDVENLIPGSPAWEREIERSIRGAAGMIVLLSPDSNDSEWVRREISFAEQNEKRIFPVLIRGDEDDSIPLRLASHQRVDLRTNFESGLDELAGALTDHLGTTVVIKRKRAEPEKTSSSSAPALRKLAVPGLLALLVLVCIGGLILGARFVYGLVTSLPTGTVTAPPTTEPFVLATAGTPATNETTVPVNTNPGQPRGKIVYTCQVKGDEICIINADGSGWRQLTDQVTASSYASLSPDGAAVVFVSGDQDRTEIYELELSTGTIRQLTDFKNKLGAPEISPDNRFVAFTYRPASQISEVWIMNRDGSHPRELYSSSSQEAHDPTWSPDGTQILFARGKGENNKLYVIPVEGGEPELINNTIDTRGRSDWSLTGLVSFDMGGFFKHDVYIMNVDGTNLRRLTEGDNAQGASFSPDGEWLAFTAYTDVTNQDQASCEIFIMRVDGTDRRRLTNNRYCDYQPRWGN